jgi:hypothetical protein
VTQDLPIVPFRSLEIARLVAAHPLRETGRRSRLGASGARGPVA